MSKCDHCGKQCSLPFHCVYCGRSYCSDHRFPPSHNCMNEAGWRNRTSGSKSDINTAGNSSLPLKECFFCGVNTSKIFYCPLCGREFCSLHKLHQDHYSVSHRIPEQQKSSTPTNAGRHSKSYHRYHLLEALFIIVAIMLVVIFILSVNTDNSRSGTTNLPVSSTTNYASNSQYIPPTISPPIGEYATVQTTQTTSIKTPIPLAAKKYEAGLSAKTFAYVLRGISSTIKVNLNSGVYNEILSKEPPAACIRYNYDSSPCTSDEIRQYFLKYIDEPDQKKYLDSLVNSIKSTSPTKDDQVRIAISLVQTIPYDYSKSRTVSAYLRYPYDVLYENTGICEEKSLLLAYLLRELGYGVVLFEFKSENHMAVGIKSPIQYSYINSGYAFVESTSPTIITDSQEDYVGAGKLTSTPQIFQISDGNSMTSISEEYNDAITFHQVYDQITQIHNTYGDVLDQYQYSRWMSLDNQWRTLCNKYGLKILTSS